MHTVSLALTFEIHGYVLYLKYEAYSWKMHIYYSFVYWDLKQGSNYVLFSYKSPKDICERSLWTLVGFSHSLPKTFPSKSDFPMICTCSVLCLESVVSDWYGGSVFQLLPN